jgi:hypothetical protein
VLWLVLLSPCVLVRADAADFDTLPLADALDFEPADSTRISGVRPGSVLDTLGLRAGDVLTAINHQAVQDSTAVRVALSNLDELHLETIDFQRDGRRGVIVNRGSLRSRTFDPIFVQREREPSEAKCRAAPSSGTISNNPRPPVPAVRTIGASPGTSPSEDTPSETSRRC